MNPIREAKPLTEYYREVCAEPTPRQALIQELADLTMSSPITVQAWCTGRFRPDKVKAKLIANYLNLDPDALFPTPSAD